MTDSPLSLFQGYGVELEYMIVDRTTLDVRPITDRVMLDVAGEYASEVEMGAIAWSNELALHVIELKTNGPTPSLNRIADQFQQQVTRINEILAKHNAQLLPTAMHPWMDPHRELTLWPHDYNPVYEAFHRIFDCRGHGWANLQSVHLNLPFADDSEFGSLHAAIRLLLPILPALSASSPFADRRDTGWMDYRMEVYRHNAERVPMVAGEIVPEPVFTQADYDAQILQPLYQQIAPLDPEETLQDEWLNARGAIARFQRNAIEIRVLDVQECPAADLAICRTAAVLLQQLVRQRWSNSARQQQVSTESLAAQFRATIRDAERAPILDRTYVEHFGFDGRIQTVGELWHGIVEKLDLQLEPLNVILQHGPLARRIHRAVAGDVTRLPHVYRELGECLASGKMFGIA